MSIIDGEHKFNKNLESPYLDEYELIDLPMEQSGGLSHKHAGVGKALDVHVRIRRGWHHLKKVPRNCFRDCTPACGVLCLLLHILIIGNALARILG